MKAPSGKTVVWWAGTGKGTLCPDRDSLAAPPSAANGPVMGRWHVGLKILGVLLMMVKRAGHRGDEDPSLRGHVMTRTCMRVTKEFWDLLLGM